MKLLRDEPQQLLVLEAPALGIPPVVGYVVKALVFLFVVAPVLFFATSLLRPARPELPLVAFGAVFALFWMIGASRVFVGLRKAMRFPRRVRVDRYAGELEIGEEGLLEGTTTALCPRPGGRRCRRGSRPSRPRTFAGRRGWPSGSRGAKFAS